MTVVGPNQRNPRQDEETARNRDSQASSTAVAEGEVGAREYGRAGGTETPSYDPGFQRTAALLAILSAPVSFGAFALILLATNFNPEAVGDPRVLLAIGAEGASQMHWGLVLNMFGYYLLLVPVILVLRAWVRAASPGFADLFTLGGLMYVLVGAMGSAMLLAIWPPLMTEYAQAAAQERQAIEAVFVGLTNAVQIGLWNMLELFPGGLWWLGIGLLLWKQRRVTAIVTSALGVITLMAAAGWYLNLPDLARGLVMVYVMLAPLWALWIGVAVLRRSAPDRGASHG